MNITPEIWKLRSLPQGEKLGEGIYLDGTHAIATDGRYLVAVPCSSPPLPPTQRLIFHYPAVLPGLLDVPEDVGLHAVECRGMACLVEVRDVYVPFPNWRRVTPRPRGNVLRLDATLLREILDAMPAASTTVIDLDIGNPLDPVLVAHGVLGVDLSPLAIIMPVRIDK